MSSSPRVGDLGCAHNRAISGLRIRVDGCQELIAAPARALPVRSAS